MGKDLLIEREWDDRDWDDRDDPSFPDDDSLPIHYEPPVQKPKTLKPKLQRQTAGKEYPIDVWFQISAYIAPEDIGRFASICRAANRVVNSVPFWIRTFRRFDGTQARRVGRLLQKEELPIVRNYVIRSLYHVYPSFRCRWDKNEAIQKDPHFLVSARCLRIWFSKRTAPPEGFNYYFEFRFEDSKPSSSSPVRKPKSPILQSADELCLDHQSVVLHVVSSNFISIGPLMGMILSDVQMPISCNFRFHKLKLVFDSYKGNSSKSIVNKPTVTIDPLVRLKIYRWFDCPANLE